MASSFCIYRSNCLCVKSVVTITGLCLSDGIYVSAWGKVLLQQLLSTLITTFCKDGILIGAVLFELSTNCGHCIFDQI